MLPPAPEFPGLSPELASRLARLSLDSITREYPNKPWLILESEEDLQPPRVLCPAFYGSFDWHSAVRGHWAALKLLRSGMELPESARIREILDNHFQPERIHGEIDSLSRATNKYCECPYGWAWLLYLYSELIDGSDGQLQAWKECLQPLSVHLAERTKNYISMLPFPIRHGAHSNTAFCLALVFDYARRVGHNSTVELVTAWAKSHYKLDENYPVWYEPSGSDFLSPFLAELDLMRRVMPGGEFQSWLPAYLPDEPPGAWIASLNSPEVHDCTDPVLGHLIGLSFHRAWTMLAVARDLPDGSQVRDLFLRLSADHAHRGLEQMQRSDYNGTHWLATFAIRFFAEIQEASK